MAEATSTADPDPAAIAALKHVGLAGGLTETKVSCAALGDRLDASTQTASRRLQTLESVGYIERDVVGDGQWVRVTDDAGEAALRAEYADYRRLFETDVELVLRGAVTGGMGEGRHYITLPGYAEQFRARLGYEPFPGHAQRRSRRRASAGAARWPASMRCRSTWEGEDRTYGAASCYGVTRRHGRRALRGGPRDRPRPHPPRRRPARTDRPERLRDALGLGDGDAVEGPRSRHKSGGHPESDDVEESDDENETPRGPRRDGGRLMRADADTDVDAVPGSDADSVNRALDAFRAGDPVCVHDFADREGETDIIIPAGAVDEAAVAHMRNDAGGLICVAVADSVADAFGLPFLADALSTIRGQRRPRVRRSLSFLRCP